MLASTLYPPGPLHRLPAALKLLSLALAGISLYILTHPAWAIGALGLTAGLYGVAGRQALTSLRAYRPLAILLIGLFLWQCWTLDPGQAAQQVMRMISLILLAHLITLTTRLDAMLAAVQPLFRPLTPLGLSPERLAFAVVLVVRFVPALMQTAASLNLAWRARGGTRRQRWRLLLPLFLHTLTLSDQVTQAVAARGGLAHTKPQRRH